MTKTAGPATSPRGPDGALWFTELNGGSIGRITTAGKVTEWRIHARAIDARPGSIALGKDGALWFTINNFHEIGRITTAGKITEYSAGEDIHPAGIARSSRRRAVVYRAHRAADRPDHDVRQALALSGPHRAGVPTEHYRRPRRCAVVH